MPCVSAPPAAGKKRGKAILLPFQLAVLVGIAITYTVVGGDSLAAFARGISAGGVSAGMPKFGFYLVFGGLQVLLSMLPSLHDARLISLLGALMSAGYCLIAVVMSATVHPGPEVSDHWTGCLTHSHCVTDPGVWGVATQS
jgi:hypothetical protein